jgi:hypothetical protein
MKKNSSKKLRFSVETVRVLSNPEMAGVAGGTTTAITCTNSMIICPPAQKPRHHSKHHC